MYVIAMKSAFKALEEGTIAGDEVKKYLVGLSLVVLLSAILTYGIYLIIEAVIFLISWFVSSDDKNLGDFLGRYAVVGFTALMQLNICVAFPTAFFGFLLIFVTGAQALFFLLLVAVSIVGIWYQYKRIEMIRTLSESNLPSPGFFESFTTKQPAFDVTAGIFDRLRNLGKLRTEGILDSDEFAKKKGEIIESIVKQPKKIRKPEEFLLDISKLVEEDIIEANDLSFLKKALLSL